MEADEEVTYNTDYLAAEMKGIEFMDHPDEAYMEIKVAFVDGRKVGYAASYGNNNGFAPGAQAVGQRRCLDYVLALIAGKVQQ